MSTQNDVFNGGGGLLLSAMDDHIFFTVGVTYMQRNLITPGTGQLVPGTAVPTTPSYSWPLTVGITVALTLRL